MKFLLVILFSIILSISAKSQEFLWANSYDINNCNEVAALSVDKNGYSFISGVYNASVFLPYQGDCYLLNVNPEGNIVWTEYLVGSIQIGDMAAAGSGAIIIGQSSGSFSYQGEQYGGFAPFMFIMKVDSVGTHEWIYMDEEKYGANSNIEVGEQGNIALQVRGQYNLGDWIMILDPAGNILKTKHLSATQTIAVDLAYYNDRVFINGGFHGPGSVVIDTVLMLLPSVESATYVLALNEDLIAEWASVDTTINNRDGRIEANSSGIYVYEEVLEPVFSVVNYIKKFDFNGNLITETEVPVFSNAISLYPDLTVTSSMVGLFAQNAFDFNSHKVILFDHELNLITEKVIDGASDLYSGQISSNADDIYVAHVYSGILNFNDDLTLPYEGMGKLPYIAKIGTETISTTQNNENLISELWVYPNPANKKIVVNYSDRFSKRKFLRILDLNGTLVLEQSLRENVSTFDISKISSGIYIIQLNFPDGRKLQEKLIIQ
jgi:hypothetical protein